MSNTIIESRKPISDLINSQINKNDPRVHSDKHYKNARSLVLQYVKSPEKLTESSHMYKLLLAAFDCKYEGKKEHTIIANRLFRSNKAQGLYKRIEEIQGM
jgi:hypothetical protein